jgi:hypothetical protein
MPFDNPFLDPNATRIFQPQLRPAPKRFGFVAVDPTDPGEPRSELLVTPGTKLIWDILSIQTGFFRPIAGRYAEALSPLHLPDPPLPSGADPTEWKPLTKSLCWLDAFNGCPAGLRELSISGQISLNAMASLYRLLSFRSEIQSGELPVLEIRPCQAYENSYGKFGIPMLEPVGSVPRDENLFGPILTPPPPPIIGSQRPAPPLPSADDKPGPKPEKPMHDPLASLKPARKPY